MIYHQTNARHPALRLARSLLRRCVTFDTLLGFQSEAYSCHRQWAKDLRSRREIVRLGMVAARRHGIQNYDAFEGGLTNAGGFLQRSNEQ